jgi:hypothetical protein
LVVGVVAAAAQRAVVRVVRVVYKQEQRHLIRCFLTQ